ncbi:MAG: AI-2E family transporter [Ilyomonas sp.]
MNTDSHLPLYLKLSQIVIGIVAFFFILYVGRDIIIPLVFAIILAILLNPVVNFFQRKINRILAIALVVFFALLIIIAVIYFISSQMGMFSEALSQLKQKFALLLIGIVNWISQTFNVSTEKINEWIVKTKNEGIDSSTLIIGQTLTTLSGILVIIFLLPVYVFMFLFYKPLLLDFVSRLFSGSQQQAVVEVLTETQILIQSYLVGLLVEAGIVATLNTVALLILGIDYAIVLGIIGALLNMIPYIGGIVAVALPMILAFATKSPLYAFLVLIAYIIVQFIDNNFIVPKIVASRVKINALVSIIAVFTGSALWGIPGMFLALPLTAILKVIFDRIEQLKPWGFLLGDVMPPIGKSIFNFRKEESRK